LPLANNQSIIGDDAKANRSSYTSAFRILFSRMLAQELMSLLFRKRHFSIANAVKDFNRAVEGYGKTRDKGWITEKQYENLVKEEKERPEEVCQREMQKIEKYKKLPRSQIQKRGVPSKYLIVISIRARRSVRSANNVPSRCGPFFRRPKPLASPTVVT
jgi:hypothetical protein